MEIYWVGVCDIFKMRDVNIFLNILIIDLEVIVIDLDVDIIIEFIGGLELVRSLIFKVIEYGKYIVIVNKVVIFCYG